MSESEQPKGFDDPETSGSGLGFSNKPELAGPLRMIGGALGAGATAVKTMAEVVFVGVDRVKPKTTAEAIRQGFDGMTF